MLETAEYSLLCCPIHQPTDTFFFVFFAAEELWVHVQVAPVRNEKDVVVLFLLTFKDITAQRHLEDPALKGVQMPA